MTALAVYFSEVNPDIESNVRVYYIAFEISYLSAAKLYRQI